MSAYVEFYKNIFFNINKYFFINNIKKKYHVVFNTEKKTKKTHFFNTEISSLLQYKTIFQKIMSEIIIYENYEKLK